MISAARITQFAAAACLSLALAVSATAQPADEFTPRPGQPGKDVIWLPTRQAVVDKMLEIAKVTPDDFVIDLGSGDGRTVISAAQLGAEALGIEYNPKLVEYARRRAAEAEVTDRASFVQADIFESDLSRASVITMFLLPELNIRLRPTLLAMDPGTRVVSNSFTMGDWAADQTASVNDDCFSHCTAFLWIVPVKAAGVWKTDDGEIRLHQKYQMLNGEVVRDGVAVALTQGKISGRELTFTAGGVEYVARIDGASMEGVRKEDAGETAWRATLVE